MDKPCFPALKLSLEYNGYRDYTKDHNDGLVICQGLKKHVVLVMLIVRSTFTAALFDFIFFHHRSKENDLVDAVKKFRSPNFFQLMVLYKARS